jgi:hypothetical protein
LYPERFKEALVHTHIRVLGILQIIYAAWGLLLAAGVLALFGGLATLVTLNITNGDAFVAAPLMAGVGVVAAGFIAMLSVPRLVAGIGLLRNRAWARVLTIIVSILGLFDVPVGLALGVYGLVVMFRDDVARQLGSPASAQTV